MIYVDHKITLDVHNVAAQEFVRLKKKDSARRILVYLTEKSKPYQITEDCYAVFTAKKPDGKVIFNDCTIDGNTIIYEITDQTTAAVGQFDAEIKLYGGDGKLITSPFFTIVVADTVYDEGDEIESTDEYNALAALIERVQSLETTSALVCKVALPMVALEGMTVSIPVENMSRTPKVGEAFIAMAAKRYTVFQVVAVSQNTFAATVLASVDTGGTGGTGGGIAVETDPTVPAWAKQPNKPTYTASEVGARPDTWTPTAQEVGALPNSYTPPNQTAEQVGADPKGTAASEVSKHNTADSSHSDIRLLITGLTNRLNALANSTDTDLDQMAELVAYIKNNKSLIDAITTSKVSVADIVNNLTTNVANKPLSAAQGVALKALIDAITVPTKLSQLTNDKGYITGYTETDPTVPAWAKNATKPSYSKSEVGLGNVDNVKQYSASNPPPYPVTSVNGKTGAVALDAAAVGARPSTWMPSASDVGALPASTTIPTKVSQLTNDKGYLTEHQDISHLTPTVKAVTKAVYSELTTDDVAQLYADGIRMLIVEDDNANMVPSAISANGGIYNGCGYMNGIRLNSSGEIITSRQACVTGFIPFTYGKKLYAYGSKGALGNFGQYVAAYDDAFVLLGVRYMESLSGITATADEDNVYTFTANLTESIFDGASYIRVSMNPCEGRDIIVQLGGDAE